MSSRHADLHRATNSDRVDQEMCMYHTWKAESLKSVL